MNIPIKNKIDVAIPPKGYVFPFIDQDDMQLKARLSDGLVISYSNVDICTGKCDTVKNELLLLPLFINW